MLASLFPYFLVFISLAFVAVAAYLIHSMWSLGRPVSRDRLESAVRPAAGRVISWQAPPRSYDRVGSN